MINGYEMFYKYYKKNTPFTTSRTKFLFKIERSDDALQTWRNKIRISALSFVTVTGAIMFSIFMIPLFA